MPLPQGRLRPGTMTCGPHFSRQAAAALPEKLFVVQANLHRMILISGASLPGISSPAVAWATTGLMSSATLGPSQAARPAKASTSTSTAQKRSMAPSLRRFVANSIAPNCHLVKRAYLWDNIGVIRCLLD